MTVEEIRLAARALVVCGARDFEVAGISTDSRTVKPGDLFVALVGGNFDGHDFLRRALASGACGAVYSRDFPIGKEDCQKVFLKVPDTLAALGDIARAYRKGLSATVVAITGSNGKTTTKEMTRHILETRMPTAASPASFNNFVGLPLTLFGADAATRVVILEMGTNHPGEIARLADIAAPDIGVITNVGHTHLEGLKSIEGVAAAKAELLHALGPGATAILNADDPALAKMRSLMPSKAFTFGLQTTADVYATAIERVNGGFAFTINDGVRARLNVPGSHNIYNALAAAAVARRLGLDLPFIAQRLADFRLPAMRLEETVIRGATIINDAYNANPESMARGIEELAQRKASRKILVFADMLELGESADALHREMGALAAGAGFDFYLAAGSLARAAVEAIVAAGVPPACVGFFAKIEDLARDLNSKLAAGDVVLIKASRAMGLDRVLDFLD